MTTTRSHRDCWLTGYSSYLTETVCRKSSDGHDDVCIESSGLNYHDPPILQHTLSDLDRTWELDEFIRAYVAGDEGATKKL